MGIKGLYKGIMVLVLGLGMNTSAFGATNREKALIGGSFTVGAFLGGIGSYLYGLKQGAGVAAAKVAELAVAESTEPGALARVGKALSNGVQTVNNAVAFTLAWNTIRFVSVFALLGMGRELWDLLHSGRDDKGAIRRRDQLIRLLLFGVAGCCLVEYYSPSVARFCQFAGSSIAVGPYSSSTAMPVPVK